MSMTSFNVMAGASLLMYLFFVQFFRTPKRIIPDIPHSILSPADGTVVVIEKTFEKEYFKDDRIQISIFMSPLDVHLNRIPFNGRITYLKYHPGDYLVAWHPKSSELNERNSIVIKDEESREILMRQIAGAVARRIVSYVKPGQIVKKGEELGFIKFGSRMDIFLPLDSVVNVKIDQKVKGGKSLLATFVKND